MDSQVIIAVVAILVAVIILGVMGYTLLFPRQDSSMRNLMAAGGRAGLGTPSEERERLKNDPTGKEYDRIKKATRSQVAKKEKKTLEELFFQAGVFSPKDRADFARMRLVIPVVTTLVGLMLGYYIFGADAFIMVAAGFGLIAGIQLPFSILERRIKDRDEDIMYFLPLVIEQIAIGVSSSLDIGPCLAKVVSMADERDSHNVVTELLRYAQYHIKSGVSLEDALTEVGRNSGHTELKHAFMSLTQVAKHGGEITRQLQELADAVSSQRETRIEGKIKKLELAATGPVAMVFFGFMIIFLIGFGIQIKGAFS
jgi:Flp pilus assembly protein TadB